MATETDRLAPIIAKARDVIARGYTALKFDPFGVAWKEMSEAEMANAEAIVSQVREALAGDVELMIEVHGRLSVDSAIEMGRRLIPYRPAWYEEPGTVPTWNYVAVHAYGSFRPVEDRDGLLDILRRTVTAYESPRPVPWSFDESEPHVEKLLGAIVGFRIEIARLEGMWKLSQNHPEGRRRKVIDGLRGRADEDSRSVAALMSEGLGPG